jgi:eukaryotic-like serine/threonine-protein kinase
MSEATTAKRMKLAGMKILIEDLLSTDDDGKVFRISDRGGSGKRYALKVVNRDDPKDDARLDRCRASAEASAKLGHPAILTYHDYRDRKSWFRVVRGELLMDHVAGRSLAKLERAPDVGQWLLIFKHVAEAMAHMHRRGVLHGDLTAGRILLSETGAVKVIGYGQSLLKDQAHRTTTKYYAAPEQVREKVIDEKTDIYALGTLMYSLLTGKTPNALKNRGEDEMVKVPPPSALNPKVPAPLNDVILACVQRHPPRRPEAMYDVQKGLEELVRSMHLDDGKLKGLARPKEEAEPS